MNAHALICTEVRSLRAFGSWAEKTQVLHFTIVQSSCCQNKLPLVPDSHSEFVLSMLLQLELIFKPQRY